MPEKMEKGLIQYATRFHIADSGNYKVVSVIKPKGKNKGTDYQYILSGKGNPTPRYFTEGHPVQTPIERFTIRSAGEAAMVALLDDLDKVVAISDPNWIANPYLLQKVATGEVKVIGRGKSINTELVLKIQPDAVLEIGTGTKYDITQQLIELGLTPIMNCIHLEDHPLGVAEWIKYFGAFLNKEERAEKLFDKIVSQYDSLARIVKNVNRKPTVIVGNSRKGMWSTHGSSNYFIRLIHDAGGLYILEDSTDYQENLISMEKALAEGQIADLWLHPGQGIKDLKELLSEDARYQYFKSVKEQRVYNNTQWLSEGGRNHYWEEGVMEPHLLLADLIRIFHPSILPNHKLKYYQLIQ